MNPLASTIGITDEIAVYILPRRRAGTWDWVCKNIRTKDGVPFNPLDYPWGKGVCDAWDDPRIRIVWLQTCARIGKTTLANSIMICSLERDPRPAMIGAPTETLLKEAIKDKYIPMIARSPIASWLRPAHRRLQNRIDLERCPVYGAWAGSTSALADKDPAYLHGGEIDKWSKNKSEEADPLYLFLERGAEIPERKVLLESTPSIADYSRVNRGLVNGTDCRFHLPCPHCGRYQQMIRGDGTKGGLIWDRTPDGKSDPDLALRTARYRCAYCSREIHDDQRRRMLQAGVWCPRGCHVERGGRLSGTPDNPGTRDASFQLSRLYSPTFSFGDYAREWLISRDDVERMRNFVNSWEGEVWYPNSASEDWQVVGARLAGEHMKGTVPDGVRFITAGVDVQVDHWVYTIVGWGLEGSGWLVDYGNAHSWNELRSHLQQVRASLPVIFSLVDARDGNRTDEVIGFCEGINRPAGPWVWPSMGTPSGLMGQKPFIRQKLLPDGGTTRSHRRGLTTCELVKVNTNLYQSWIQSCIERRVPGDPNSLTLCAEAAGDEDFLEQILNERVAVSETTTGHDKMAWIVISRHVPVDFRDSLRYARAAADVFLNGNWDRVPTRLITTPAPQQPQPVQHSPQPQPGNQGGEGRGWFNRDRLGGRRFGRRR